MKKYLMGICLISGSILTNAQDLTPGSNSPNPQAPVSGSILTLLENDEKKMKSDMGLLLFMGINNSSLSGDENYNSSILGLHVGGGVNLANLSKSWRVRSEMLFSQQGGQSSYGSETYGGKTVLKLSYLELGLLARFQANSGFYAEAGLQPGLLLGAKRKNSFTGPGGGGQPSTDDVKDDLNSFDVGVPLGAGYVFKKKLAVSLRFTPGLLKINKDEVSESKAKNSVLSARVSYFL